MSSPRFETPHMSIHDKHLLDSEMNNLPMQPNNSQGEGDSDHDTGFAATTEKPKLKQPPLYKVILINDDYTPMEFVIYVLQRFFSKSAEEATKIMLHVHQNGVGICGVFTYEVAETKVTQVMDMARQHDHPLQCTMEKD